MVPELGIHYDTLGFNQRKRKYGKSKNNFFSLLGLAITSAIKYSVFPAKLFINFGFLCAFFQV